MVQNTILKFEPSIVVNIGGILHIATSARVEYILATGEYSNDPERIKNMVRSGAIKAINS